MKDLKLKDVQPGDLFKVLSDLRIADRQELYASAGLQTTIQLIKHFEAVKPHCSSFKVLVLNDAPVGLVGVVNHGEVGVIWSVGTDKMTLKAKSFHKLGKEYLAEQLAKYKVLENKVWSNNVAHIEWLKRLNFSFGKTDNQGFIPFRIEHV